MITGLCAAFLAGLIGAFVYKWRRGEELDLLPSLCWGVFIAVPFAVQASGFSPRYVGIQAVGVFVVAAVLLLGDVLPPWRGLAEKTSVRPLVSEPFERRFCYVATVVLMILPAIHLGLMPRIPLVDRWKYEHSDETIAKVLRKRAIETSNHRAVVVRALEQASSGKPAEEFERAVGEFLDELVANAEADAAMLKRVEALPAGDAEAGALEPLAAYDGWLAPRRNAEIQLGLELRSLGAANVTGEKASAFLATLRVEEKEQSQKAEAVFQGLNDAFERSLQKYREESSKLLNVPRVFTYGCESAMLLAPVVVLLFLRNRAFVPAVLLLGASLVYSKATLARGPILGMVLLCACLAWAFIPKRLRLTATALVVLSVVAGAALGAYALVTNPFSITNWRVPRANQEANLGHAPDAFGKGDMTFTLGDHHRLLDVAKTLPEYRDLPEPTFVSKMVNYVGYRAFLVPIEVSHRWYTYFPDVHGSYFGWQGLVPGSKAPEYRHPSNLVGVWGYQARFPTHYLDSVSAYASADADAYGRWGMAGIFGLAALLLALRWLLKILRTDTFAGTCLYLAAVIELALNLPAASLQAILAAHGVAVFVFLLCLIRLWDLRLRASKA